MPIRISCPHCTTVLHAKDSLAGQHVNCANCALPVYVEPPSLQASDRDARSDASEIRLSPVEERPFSSQSDNSRVEGTPPRPPQSASACLKCGAPLSVGQEHCQSCYFHAGLRRVVDTRDDSDLDVPAASNGFQRYLQKKLHNGQSAESVFYLFDFFCCLLLLAISVWFGLPFYLGLASAALYVGYRVIAETCGLSYRGASLLWRMVLFFGRGLQWKTFGGQTRLACTRRGREFGDSDLAQLEDLQGLQVLDLETTGVTDAGLVFLQNCSSLEFLVLRKTDVTAGAVWQLQKSIPESCIWH